MPLFINYLLICLFSIYSLFILFDLIGGKPKKWIFLQIAFLAIVFIFLHIGTGFPKPKVTFGDTAILGTVVIILITTILGMAANYFFYLKSKKFSFKAFVRPFFISPIVILPLLGTILNYQNLSEVQLVSFSFLAFQNGFFWKLVLDNAYPKM